MAEQNVVDFDERWTPVALTALRVITALLFLQHGTAKIFGFPWAASMAYPPTFSLFWVAGWMEVIGSLMLLAGLFTRPVAFLLAGEMAVAYWYIHAPDSFYPMINRGESAVLFCFVFLLFVATGGGRWSVDCMMARKRSPIEGYAAPGGERTFYSDDDQ